MRFLCWLGIHNWSSPFNHRGGETSNHPLIAIAESIFNPRKCDCKCLRCGKIKEFLESERR